MPTFIIEVFYFVTNVRTTAETLLTPLADLHGRNYDVIKVIPINNIDSKLCKEIEKEKDLFN